MNAPPLARRTNRIGRFTRVALAVMAAGFAGVFVTAALLNPYQEDGTPRTHATHTQLGLPPCNMLVLTGKPCPSCGMTTSFALLAHGDVGNSLRANWAGTLIAVMWLALVPWGLIAAVRGRLPGVRNGELFATVCVGIGLTVALVRWGIILLL